VHTSTSSVGSIQGRPGDRSPSAASRTDAASIPFTKTGKEGGRRQPEGAGQGRLALYT